jgi:hypothetical protein
MASCLGRAELTSQVEKKYKKKKKSGAGGIWTVLSIALALDRIRENGCPWKLLMNWGRGFNSHPVHFLLWGNYGIKLSSFWAVVGQIQQQCSWWIRWNEVLMRTCISWIDLKVVRQCGSMWFHIPSKTREHKKMSSPYSLSWRNRLNEAYIPSISWHKVWLLHWALCK